MVSVSSNCLLSHHIYYRDRIAKRMFLDRPLQDYLDELASAQPTPGGGAAAALSGAQAAALASMVARLTIGKADYAAVQPEIAELLQQTEQLRAIFQQLMQD